MRIVYKTDDGNEFGSKELAEKWENIRKERVEWTVTETRVLIPLSELGTVFEVGTVYDLRLCVRNPSGEVEEDGGYDIYSLDEDGHLHCSDETHGILAWSDKDGCYCRWVYGNKWTVEVLGIEKVSYV